MILTADQAPAKRRQQYFVEAIPRRIDLVPRHENRKKLRNYANELGQKGVAPQTILSYLDAAVPLGQHLKKRSWSKATREDILDVISNHRVRRGAHRSKKPLGDGAPLSARTKNQWFLHQRRFYQWLLNLDEGEAPQIFKKSAFSKKKAEQKRGRELALSPLEIQKLAAGATNARDQLLIALALELGVRASEAAAFRLDSFTPHEWGYQFTIPDDEPFLKTGPRDIPIYLRLAAPLLDAWLEQHPRRHDPKAGLFVTLSQRSYAGRMTGQSIADAAKRCATRAGLKGFHIHRLRATSASMKLAAGWTLEAVRLWHGWSAYGNTMAHYTDTAAHFDQMYAESNRLKLPGKSPVDMMGNPPCALCGAATPFGAAKCPTCDVLLLEGPREAQARERQQVELEHDLRRGLEAFRDNLYLTIARLHEADKGETA